MCLGNEYLKWIHKALHVAGSSFLFFHWDCQVLVRDVNSHPVTVQNIHLPCSLQVVEPQATLEFSPGDFTAGDVLLAVL